MHASPRNPARRRLNPVTIAIGFPFKNGMLVASDSQMSIGDKYKQWDEPKISQLKFADGRFAVLAISGMLSSARYFQEHLESAALSSPVTNDRTIPNLAEVSLKRTREKLLDFINQPQVTPDERQTHLAENNFESLVAFFHGTPPRPFIYRLRLFNGIAELSRHPYEAIGCGSDIAGFILTGGKLGTYEQEEALALAFYVIEACKKFDQACGGPVQHMFLSNNPTTAPAFAPPEVTKSFEEAVRSTEPHVQNMITQSIMSDVHQAYMKLIESDKQ